MAETRFDVVGIGNAIVDVLANAEDSFLATHGMPKGGMVLIDGEKAEAIYAAMGSAIESSGGSAANTVAGIASLGGKPAFIGKVAEDTLGRVFRHDIGGIGVHFDTPVLGADAGVPTARCLILVTPDAQRTMNTYLGACTRLAPADIDEDLVASAQVTYVEGYQWDAQLAKDAIVRASLAAKEAGRTVALSLSDAFCVDRHRGEFLELTEGLVDILFANEAEIKSLYETDSFEAAVQAAREHVDIACITRSEKGSVIVRGQDTVVVEAHRPARLVDTTGAGDLYASGFLFGYTRGKSLAECGHLASRCAAEIISHMGARPDVPLKSLLAEEEA
ncbi:adenosine kinase [Caenispirillum bisanense]|uniref:Sugar or nucleoside kinase, ribokinase family n=1 Tax=Caenispirillum bisanense TaxID=414052 RepID=A0A286GA36_9PROT|nr:adenosine kinase [Caenispirillum bisanense]SOD92096.1 Sugar or nucleoside kinase, ribokinase family [Caenispirillum bisanense]